MEELLGIVGFSFGASLGIGAVRSLGTGSRPLLRDLLKAGIRTWDGLASAGASLRAQAAEEATAGGGRRGRAQKILIAKD